MAKGILIDYEWCSGCHTCEMACAVETTHASFPEGHCGVKVHEEGIYQIAARPVDRHQHAHLHRPVRPVRGAYGAGEPQEPTCVKHCQAHVLQFGDVEDLAKDLAAKPKQVLVLPGGVESRTSAFGPCSQPAAGPATGAQRDKESKNRSRKEMPCARPA